MAKDFDYNYDFDDKKKVSAFSVIEVIVIILLVIAIIGMIAFNVVFRKDNEATSIFGYSFYKTRAVNMVPKIPVNTVVVAKKSEIENINVGSVILCNIGERSALTRVVEMQQENGQQFYIVKFDTSPATETFRVEKDAVIAKAVWQLESFGKFLDFATSVPGIIIAIVVPLGIIIIIQVVKIRNIRELEREASSIDDIDDLIISKKKEEPPAVTFTQPKFDEKVEEPAPAPTPVVRRPATTLPGFEPAEEKPKAKLTVDSRGRADYGISDTAAKEPAYSFEGGSPVRSAPAEISRDDRYINRPTRIEPRQQDDFAASIQPEAESGKVVFTPHISNVIPEKVADIQNDAVTKHSFDDSVKSYFEKSTPKQEAPVQPAYTVETEPVSTIPEKAVVPKENIAPVRKKKSSRTLEELMSIIDAEESKLKK